jgi:hypothetical protein
LLSARARRSGGGRAELRGPHRGAGAAARSARALSQSGSEWRPRLDAGRRRCHRLRDQNPARTATPLRRCCGDAEPRLSTRQRLSRCYACGHAGGKCRSLGDDRRTTVSGYGTAIRGLCDGASRFPRTLCDTDDDCRCTTTATCGGTTLYPQGTCQLTEVLTRVHRRHNPFECADRLGTDGDGSRGVTVEVRQAS